MIGEDDGSSTGNNPTEYTTGNLDGVTIELVPGEETTVSVDGQSHTIECVAIDDFENAELIVDGVNEGEFDQDETVVDEGDQQLRVRKVISDYDIEDVDGNQTGAQYNGVVLEAYADSLDEKVDGIPEGDWTATMRYRRDGSDIVDPFLAELEHVDFSIVLNQPPEADFSFSPNNPDAFESVSFTDESTDPQGDNTITKWEWDFGDGTTQTINSAPGDITHSYGSGGTYTVRLTVTDDQGATDFQEYDITVNDIDASDNTVEMSGVKNVGASTSSVSSQVIENANTVDFSGVSNVGAQKTPAEDSYMLENVEIPYRDISGSYEVYIASQGSGSAQIGGNVTLQQINHEHDIPRQDDFADSDPEVGAGAENKEIPFEKSSNNRGDVNLDFSTNDEAITLDTTVSSNDVTITVANEDSQGNLTNSEQLSANNGTDTTSNTYQDSELYIRIDSANNTDNFEVRGQLGDDVYTLAAVSQNSFQSDKTSQVREGVSGDDGSEQDVVENVDSELLAGSTANNVRIFIDDQPDSGGNTEQEITGALYGGSSDSGTSKDRNLD